jgi:uncharacterized protein
MAAPLPNRSVRVAPEHGDVLNSVLALLRAGREDEVRAALRDIEHDDGHPVGPFRNAKAALGIVLGRLVATAHPQAIWLFGSRARGDHRPDSDFDLLALFNDDEDLDNKRNAMADAVAGIGVGVDLTACTIGEFEQFRDTAGSLIRTVHAEGHGVYLSPSARRQRANPTP